MTSHPSLEVRKATLLGTSTGWDYICPACPVNTNDWDIAEWINHIGDRWFVVAL